jgi:hypothetical protein
MFLVVGLIGAAMIAIKRHASTADGTGHRIVFALLLLVVPILIMSLFRDRELRYVIPLLMPAAVLAGWGLLELLGASAVRRRHTPWLVAAFHWLPLMFAAVVLPLGGAFQWFGMSTFDGGPWYPLRHALIATEVLLVFIALTIWFQRRAGAWAVLAGTAAVMIAWNVFLNVGYRHSREGRSEMRPLAEQIIATHPDAGLYSFRPDRPIRRAPIDLSIYLNRVVENVEDPTRLAETSGLRIYMVRQKDAGPMSDPSPLAPPAGGPWRFFTATRVDNATWYTFASTTRATTPATTP